MSIKRLLIVVALLTGWASSQTTTTITGTLKDLTGAAVTSGKVTFTLRPSSDTTISSVARFSPNTITCMINASGQIKAQDDVSTCTVTMNTALQPPGSYYQVCDWPYNVKTACFNFYAVLSTYDWSTVVPTPTTSPAQSFVDIFSNQTIGGTKTFSGDLVFSGNPTFSGNPVFSGFPVRFTGTGIYYGAVFDVVSGQTMFAFGYSASYPTLASVNFGPTAQINQVLTPPSSMTVSDFVGSFFAIQGPITTNTCCTLEPLSVEAEPSFPNGFAGEVISGEGTAKLTGLGANSTGGFRGNYSHVEFTGNGGGHTLDHAYGAMFDIGKGSSGLTGAYHPQNVASVYAGLPTPSTYLIFDNPVYSIYAEGASGIGGVIQAPNEVISPAGIETWYRGVATVGNGHSEEYARVDPTAQGANIGNTTIYTASSTGGGLYRLSCYVIVTQAATVSSTLPSCVIAWTDADNNIAQSLTLTPTNTGNALTTFQQASMVLDVKASTAINYTTSGYATSGATSMQYAVHIRLESF